MNLFIDDGGGGGGGGITSTALWHFDSTKAADIGGTNYDVSTTYNTTTISAAASKFGGNSLLFSDSGQGANAATGTSLSANGAMFSGDLTFDMWVNTNSQSEHTIWSFGNSDSDYVALRIESGKLVLRTEAGTYIVGTTTWSNGSFHHVAVVRNGTRTDIYLDGTSEGNTTTAIRTYGTAKFINFGGKPGEGFNHGATMLFGYLDEARLVIGTAAWTTTFTPSVAAYTT